MRRWCGSGVGCVISVACAGGEEVTIRRVFCIYSACNNRTRPERRLVFFLEAGPSRILASTLLWTINSRSSGPRTRMLDLRRMSRRGKDSFFFLSCGWKCSTMPRKTAHTQNEHTDTRTPADTSTEPQSQQRQHTGHPSASTNALVTSVRPSKTAVMTFFFGSSKGII